MITAHTGSDGYVANSLAFVEAMVEAQVDAFEIDVHLAEDGSLYLAHDEQATWQDLAQLQEVYQILKDKGNGQTLINVDCKSGLVGKPALALAEQMGVLDQVVLSGALALDQYSQDHRRHLFYNLENHFDFKRWPLSETELKDILHEISQAGVKTVQSYYGVITQDHINWIHQAGLALSVWTIDDIPTIQKYLDMGADNITTNIALVYRQEQNH